MNDFSFYVVSTLHSLQVQSNFATTFSEKLTSKLNKYFYVQHDYVQHISLNYVDILICPDRHVFIQYFDRFSK